MRHKKNITLSSENIILFFRNITSHFTGEVKIIALVLIIIILSFINITLCFPSSFNVSALSYQNSVGIGFTFNPTLSVNILPSDLTIDNLTPGTASDSDAINVSVATNTSYGYTLSAIMNGNNNNLTHTNGTDTFSSIATDASLSSLTTDNTWGYSYKLSNDTNWNNYSGLSNETSKILVDSNDQTAIPIDFKITAKASSAQASGTYAGTINFTAISKPTPMNLAESYFAAGKTRHNGYYAMQDMTSEICNNTEVVGEGSQTELIDLRDDKVYWATKLADGHCWMTQNLNLDLDSNRTYTHWDTDLGWNTENSNTIDENATWQPIRSTINFSGTNVSGWQKSNTEPYSANPGDIYFYTSNSNTNDIRYNSLQECIDAKHSDCTHYHAGNYYNWNATVASNDTSSITNNNAPNSICPRGWRLPIATNNSQNIIEFSNLLYTYYGITTVKSGDQISDNISYAANGLNKLRTSPLWFVRPGAINGNGTSYNLGSGGDYQYNTPDGNLKAYNFIIRSDRIRPAYNSEKYYGTSIRCLVR